MRYGVPRSTSPSPTRRNHRRSSTFGIQSDSDYTDSSNGSDTESESDSDSQQSSASSSSNSFCYESLHRQPKRRPMTSSELRHIEDTVAAIRLRVRHHDPYEEWERQMKKDAFRTARKEQSVVQSQLHDMQGKAHTQESKRLAAQHFHQVAEVQAQLDAFNLQKQKDEKRLREEWKERDRKLWERIETGIKFEEDKLRARLEAERKVREEEEKKRKEEELKKRLEEEKKKSEEEAKRKEEEEKKRLLEKEEEAKRLKEEEERKRKEQLQTEEQERKALGFTTAEEDWKHARKTLKELKAGPMKIVKSTKELKSTWSALRRQITPKIGQLTNDPQAITRISQQLHHILIPPSAPHSPDVYHALLSSLAKTILLQAETEVTAEKRSAGPLALVTANLLGALAGFPEIFFAKLVQRAGGWPAPSVVPSTDVDGVPWKDEDERLKAMGYRKGNGEGLESTSEYISRVAGMMRVYFSILKAPVASPLDRMFQLPRYWIWFARMIGERGLLETAVAPQVMYAALEEFGLEAKSVWGHQWVKMLALLHEGVTVGLGGDSVIGGQSTEGKASRVRVQLEVERIMNS